MATLYHGTTKGYHDDIVSNKGEYTHRMNPIELLKKIWHLGPSIAMSNYRIVNAHIFLTDDPSRAASHAAFHSERRKDTPIVLKVRTDDLTPENGELIRKDYGSHIDYVLSYGSLKPPQCKVVNLISSDVARQVSLGTRSLDGLPELQA